MLRVILTALPLLATGLAAAQGPLPPDPSRSQPRVVAISPDRAELAAGLASGEVRFLELDQAGISVEPDSLGFGEVPVGAIAALTVTVTSTGDRDLLIGPLTTDDDNFTVEDVDCLDAPVPTDSRCEFEVWYQPTDTSGHSGTLAIDSNADEQPVTVALTGQGQTPFIFSDRFESSD